VVLNIEYAKKVPIRHDAIDTTTYSNAFNSLPLYNNSIVCWEKADIVVKEPRNPIIKKK
tara:strand:- start:63 stop:239 length:177 start_codon:yes stop_codon:yes gene_type:complete